MKWIILEGGMINPRAGKSIHETERSASKTSSTIPNILG